MPHAPHRTQLEYCRYIYHNSPITFLPLIQVHVRPSRQKRFGTYVQYQEHVPARTNHYIHITPFELPFKRSLAAIRKATSKNKTKNQKKKEKEKQKKQNKVYHNAPCAYVRVPPTNRLNALPNAAPKLKNLLERPLEDLHVVVDQALPLNAFLAHQAYQSEEPIPPPPVS